MTTADRARATAHHATPRSPRTHCRLLKGADTVELKVSIPTDAQRATIQGLPLDPVEAQPRQIFFFDTPDLALNQAGVVVRARRIQGGRGDTVDQAPAGRPRQSSRRTSGRRAA